MMAKKDTRDMHENKKIGGDREIAEAAAKDGTGECGKILIDKKELDAIREDAERQIEEYKDRYLRAHADLDNMRKRLDKEKKDYLKFALEDLFIEILYVIDNFDRALEHMDAADKNASIVEGLTMIQKQFHQLLQQKGVEKIHSMGKPFDPAVHEAVGHLPVAPEEDGTVIEEVQAGYTLHGRLLRPAAVKVGKTQE